MDSTASSSSTANPRFEWFLLHAGFIVIGIITNILAPSLPIFSRQWSLTYGQAGLFFPAQYITSMFGVVATGWLVSCYSSSKVLAFSFLFLTLGMAFLGISPWILTATCVASNGFGYGLANPTTNLRATQLPSKSVAASVSLLNFSWGVGAVASPFLVQRLAPSIGVRGLSMAVAALTLILGVVHFLRSVPNPSVTSSSRRPLSEWLNRLQRRPAIPLLLLFFLYVGTEVGVGGWVTEYGSRIPRLYSSALAGPAFIFYSFMVIGRGLAPFGLKRFSTFQISLVGLLLAALGAGLIAMSKTQLFLLIGSGAAGFGCAPQYPILVTWLAQIFREDSTWLSSLFFSAGGLGGGILPWLVGVIASQSHSLRAAFLLPLAVSLLMAVLTVRARPLASPLAST
jgi:fucose permease